MKRVLSIISLIFVFLLLSCSKSSFTLSGGRIVEDGRGRTLSVILENGEKDDQYSFSLTSPDGDLRWEGLLTLSGVTLSSDYLLLTPGASMPRGTYTLVVHSSTGTDITSEVIF